VKKDPVCKMAVNENEAVTLELDGKTYYFCSEGCSDIFIKKSLPGRHRTSYDLIIIGGGPAGLTSAVYAATLKMNAFLISKDLGGQAFDSTKIKNYMGYDFITGPELINKFQGQLLHSHYIDHLIDEVEKIVPVENGYDVITSDLKRHFTKTLILATGMKRRTLNIPGEEEFQRKGIFYGNIQDSSFVQGQSVAVVGGGNSALQMIENLHTVAKEIHLISDGPLTADHSVMERVCSEAKNLHTYEGYKVLEFTGKKSVEKISIRKKAARKKMLIPVKGVFIAIGLKPGSSLASGLVPLNKTGEIIINTDCSTSLPGVFAAGDVTNAFGKRIIIASGEGAKAALAAKQYILDLRKTKGSDR